MAFKIMMKIFMAVGLAIFLIFPPFNARAKLWGVDKVLVEKSKRTLSLLKDGKILKSYSISLGRDPYGAKAQEGDGKTPEGTYVIDWRNPNSLFHKSLHISYPNSQELAQAKRLGVSAGGMIMIHGLPNGWPLLGVAHLLVDWTNGCIAVTNEEMDEIWGQVADGTEVEILP